MIDAPVVCGVVVMDRCDVEGAAKVGRAQRRGPQPPRQRRVPWQWKATLPAALPWRL